MRAGAGTLSGGDVSATGGTSAALDGPADGDGRFGGRRLISVQVGIRRSRRGNAARRGRRCGKWHLGSAKRLRRRRAGWFGHRRLIGG